MLRCLALTGGAILVLPPRRVALTAFLLAVIVGGAPDRAWADWTQGTPCTHGGPATAGISGSTNGGSMVQPAAGNNLACESGTWQYPTYIFGDDTTSSDSASTCSQAGEVRWNATNAYLQYCNGTNWYEVGWNNAPTAGCGNPGTTLNGVQATTINVAAGCHLQIKAWGAGGSTGASSCCQWQGSGAGGGAATITLGPLGSSTTYYVTVGGGGNCQIAGSGGTGFTGGAGGRAPVSRTAVAAEARRRSARGITAGQVAIPRLLRLVVAAAAKARIAVLRVVRVLQEEPEPKQPERRGQPELLIRPLMATAAVEGAAIRPAALGELPPPLPEAAVITPLAVEQRLQAPERLPVMRVTVTGQRTRVPEERRRGGVPAPVLPVTPEQFGIRPTKAGALHGPPSSMRS